MMAKIQNSCWIPPKLKNGESPETQLDQSCSWVEIRTWVGWKFILDRLGHIQQQQDE